MRIAIHDGDGNVTRFPNLALMKISAYAKARGDSVDWFDALVNQQRPYDIVYSSKVFTFTPRDPFLPDDAMLGGTGYGRFDELPPAVESIAPDYSLYPDFPHALGFITRGCIRDCPWCIVPRKEGRIRFERHAGDVAGDKGSAVFMDNNFLAWDGHADELARIIRAGLSVDFNQGLDARLVTEGNAPLLARVRWLKYIRFSCDTPAMRETVQRAVGLVRAHGYKGYPYCNVLIKDVSEALETVEFLRSIKVDPFAQAFMDYSSEDKRTPEQRRFCRWVNHKAIFKSVKWRDYKG